MKTEGSIGAKLIDGARVCSFRYRVWLLLGCAGGTWFFIKAWPNQEARVDRNCGSTLEHREFSTCDPFRWKVVRKGLLENISGGCWSTLWPINRFQIRTGVRARTNIGVDHFASGRTTLKVRTGCRRKRGTLLVCLFVADAYLTRIVLVLPDSSSCSQKYWCLLREAKERLSISYPGWPLSSSSCVSCC